MGKEFELIKEQLIQIFPKLAKDTDCIHAARERHGDGKMNGKWTSKLGSSNDISHATPYSIEGATYGKVACIMKRKWE